MLHCNPQVSASKRKVFDVVAVCRSLEIQEREIQKVIRLIGRFATRADIQMNLTRRPTRFR